MKIIIVAVFIALLLTSETVIGVPADPEPFNLTQPDNSSFQARQVGDERAAHFETLDGYTIVQDETGWWSYAKKDEKGKIFSTGKRVGLIKPEKLDLPKHVHPSVAEDIFIKEPIVSVSAAQVGTKKALVILINFTDINQNASHTPAYYENLLFNTSASANSMHNYYKEVSYNQINVTGDIAGNRWYGSTHNQSFYGKDLDHTNGSHDNYYGNSFSLTREALILADSDINFATYDTNSDGVLNKEEINIIIVHAGCGEENGGCSGWSTDSIWSHKGSILGSPYGCSDCIDTFLDGKRISRNNSNEDIAGYIMQAESSPLGTFAHEYGHDLGLPDLYDGDGTSYGVGVWDIMASGMWLNTAVTLHRISQRGASTS